MPPSSSDERNLFGLFQRVVRIEERLINQDGREEDRAEMLKSIIRDAVREGLAPVHERISILEKDVAAAKTAVKTWIVAGGLLTTGAGAIAWLVDHLTGLGIK